MLKRFGDELIKDHQTAFFELIKNSFDADATLVSVKFHNTKNIDGEIIIIKPVILHSLIRLSTG
ncbi:MAG: ATP-binding protein [Bacteroidales bacterium]|nr:ATP-binding protein [Bacteroidales bacterium]